MIPLKISKQGTFQSIEVEEEEEEESRGGEEEKELNLKEEENIIIFFKKKTNNMVESVKIQIKANYKQKSCEN